MIALIAGLFLWNRWRRRIGPKSRHILPSLTVTGPHDPFTNDAFDAGAEVFDGRGRGAYTNLENRDDEWDETVEPTQISSRKGKGKERAQVEFDADDYSLRSISPLPHPARAGGSYSDSLPPSPSPTPSHGVLSIQSLSDRSEKSDDESKNPFVGREER